MPTLAGKASVVGKPSAAAAEAEAEAGKVEGEAGVCGWSFGELGCFWSVRFMWIKRTDALVSIGWTAGIHAFLF